MSGRDEELLSLRAGRNKAVLDSVEYAFESFAECDLAGAVLVGLRAWAALGYSAGSATSRCDRYKRDLSNRFHHGRWRVLVAGVAGASGVRIL